MAQDIKLGENKTIGATFPTFIIAEIGQNHQGDINVAKTLIKTAQECGADCVKFQKTNLKEKFNKTALEVAYISKNSWGATYGAHKEFLEFTEVDFLELQAYAKSLNIIFTASAMDQVSFDFLSIIKVPFIKIGSGDANNFLLIEHAAKTGIPLVISTGMQNYETVRKIYENVSKHHKQFALLHCVSAYPTPLEDINLNIINLYKKDFPDINIGYSGHELGVHISTAAVALGAKIIERHITLDKTQKGSDHSCSLEPHELKVLVENIRSLEVALGVPIKTMAKSEVDCYKKLGKSIVYAKSFPRGHQLDMGDLKIKVAVPKGVDGADLHKILGKYLKDNVDEDKSVSLDDLQDFI